MSLIWTGAVPMCAEGAAMVTEALWLAARGRSKGTGGTDSARFTLTWVDVILARLWGNRDHGGEKKQTKLRGSERRVRVIERVRSLERGRNGMNKPWTKLNKLNSTLLPMTCESKCTMMGEQKKKLTQFWRWNMQQCHGGQSWQQGKVMSAWSTDAVLTDRTSVSVTFQNVFQKWTSRFWVMRSNSAPLNSGSMAYFPEVKKELAATPAEGEERHAMNGWGTTLGQSNSRKKH